jgi:catechol 2,3-dioxygenase-like lactoylglutathione lyase family enzyme
MSTATSLPGLSGIEHVGLTVPDLEAAVRFFVDVLGGEHVFDGGAFADPEFMPRQLGVAAEARLQYAFVRLGNGPNLEIFEYQAPDQRTRPPKNSDIGGHHLALYVDDVPAAVAHLRAHDVEVLGEPVTIEDGPASGSTWVYLRAPWGLQLELVSYPGGKGPAGGPGRRLWRPLPR